MKPFWQKLENPRYLKWFVNAYPPYIGAGIRLVNVAADYSSIDVMMKLRWYNRNLLGVHFGGNLYSMVDPFFMIMLMFRLGTDYSVWDRTAKIEYIRQGKGKVTARFLITPEEISDIKRRTEDGDKHHIDLTVQVLNEHNQVVAHVIKTLYVKKKPPLTMT